MWKIDDNIRSNLDNITCDIIILISLSTLPQSATPYQKSATNCSTGSNLQAILNTKQHEHNHEHDHDHDHHGHTHGNLKKDD